MNILLIDFGSFIHTDITLTLKKMGIHFKSLYYKFPIGDEGKYHNKEFEELMLKELASSSYDLVFSTNLLPIVGKIAYDKNLPYIAWCYDSPINLISHEFFYLPNINVFLFDRTEANRYKKMGYDNFHHLPLAVNCNRLSKIKPSDKYKSEVSFLGKLYDLTYPFLKQEMADFEQGFCDALINAQLITYGAYFINECLTEDLINRINQSYNDHDNPLKGINLKKEQLSFSMASQITHIERLGILNLLSKKHDVHLYTNENKESINNISPNVNLHGPLSYLEEMPAMFKSTLINLCPALKITQSGIPLRALDIIGSGAFLLSNWQAELAENFVDGAEVVMYESIEDAIAKTEYYLTHDDERKSISESGYKKASTYFQYEDRINYMLSHARILS